MFSSFIHKNKLVICTKIPGKSEKTNIANASAVLTVKKYKNGGMETRHEIEQPALHYINWFWYLVSHGKLPFEIFSLFPNVKEQSESVAAYKTLVQHGLDHAEIIVVADGKNPRTGALFAHLHPTSTVYSIDPIMKEKYVDDQILPNLTAYANTIQDWVKTKKTSLSTRLFIVAIHPHVVFSEYINDLLKLYPTNCKVVILSIPCCFKQSLPFQQIYNTWDMNILSEKRNVIVWER